MMNNRAYPTQTDADVERAWLAALLDEQVDYPMHGAPSEGERAIYGSNANIMMKIAKNAI